MAETTEELAAGIVAEQPTEEGEAAAPEDALLEEPQEQPAEGEPDQPAEGELSDAENEARDSWDEVCPDLAGHYDDLTAKARQDILVKRLAARGERETAAKDSTRLDSADTDSELSRQPVVEIPTVDHAALQREMQQAIDDGDLEAVAAVVDKRTSQQEARVTAVMDAVLGAIQENGQKLEGFERTLSGVTMPGEFRGLLSSIPDATEADIEPAMQMVRAGDVAKPELALKLAVSERMTTLATGKRKPRESSRRKANALAASRARGESRTPGQNIDNHIPARMTSPEGLELTQDMVDGK